MTRRSAAWEEGLAERLRRPEYAKGFLMACVEDEGVPLQDALATVIRCLGVKEFAEKVGMPAPNVQRAINHRHNPTQETLNRLLEPFGLRVGLASSTSGPRRSGTAREALTRARRLETSRS